jgi:hypothetical protein
MKIDLRNGDFFQVHGVLFDVEACAAVPTFAADRAWVSWPDAALPLPDAAPMAPAEPDPVATLPV